MFAFSSKADAAGVDYGYAFSKMPHSMPDDLYNLIRKGTTGPAISPSSDCGQHGCLGTDYTYFGDNSDSNDKSHQWITLGKKSINDDDHPASPKAPYQFGKSIEMKIYTTTPDYPVFIHMTVADRGLGDKYACHNDITAVYYRGDSSYKEVGVGSQSFTIDTFKNPDGTDAHRCGGQTYALPAYPGHSGGGVPAAPDGFKEILEPNGGHTGIYQGIIVFYFGKAKAGGQWDDSNELGTQSSFNVKVISPSGGNSAIGYIGHNADTATGGVADETKPWPPSPDNAYGYSHPEHGWINSYPTAYADDHTMRFYVRPQCDMNPGTKFDVEWDDLNLHSSYQTDDMTVAIYKFKPGHASDIDPASPVFPIRSADSAQYTSFSSAPNNYGGKTLQADVDSEGRQYAYLVEFRHVQGGNGISFHSPFDSGDARIECPPVPKECDPDVDVNCGGTGNAHLTCTKADITDDNRRSVGGVLRDTRTGFYLRGTNQDAKYYLNTVYGKDDNYVSNGNVSGPNEYTDKVKMSFAPSDFRATRDGKTFMHLSRQYYDGTNWVEYASQDLSSALVCYQATCTLSVDGDGPGGEVIAGHAYTVTASITNTGGTAIPDTYPNDDQTTTNPSLPFNLDFYEGAEHDIGGPIKFGLSLLPPLTYTRTATDIGKPYKGNLTGKVEFHGWGDISASCTTGDFPIYQPVGVTVDGSAVMKPDRESPTSFEYITKLCTSGNGDAFHINTNSAAYKIISGARTDIETNPGGDYNPGCQTTLPKPPTPPPGIASIDPTTVHPGDQYCVDITAEYASGDVGPGGDVVGQTGNPHFHDCKTVVNEPYAHFFGSNVASGGGINTTKTDGTTKVCSTGPGVIRSYVKDTGLARGSGSQYGVFAQGSNEGLGSANMRAAPDKPAWPLGLSFANNDATHITANIPNPQLGGNFQEASCLPDYFAQSKPTDLTSPDSRASVSASGTGAQYYKPGSGKLRLDSGPVSAPESMFVEGDVYITGTGITYNNAGTWTQISDIPAFYLVAKGGNIYIDKDVKELDGIYIAQPTIDGSGNKVGGQINTCAEPNGGGQPVAASDLYNKCRQQLTVYGAFVGDKVILNRVHSSLRYSQAGEYPTNPPHNCGIVGSDVLVGANNLPDCAAEIFIFSPEIYLPVLPNNALTGPTSGIYQAETSLSPVL